MTAFTYQDKLDFITGQIYSRETWLKDHGHKREKFPEHEIERKRRELELMHAIRDDYARAVERKEKAA